MKNCWKGLALLGVISYLLSVAACSKSSELGLSLVEQSQSDIIFTDTLPLDMHSLQMPLQNTTNQVRTLCGAIYNDPYFGDVQAGIYMNFRINSTNVTFPNARFDSLVLMLVYDTTGHYGDILSDINTEQTWEVYRLDDPIVLGTDYNSDATLGYTDLLATKQFSLHLDDVRDSFFIMEGTASVKKPAHLRIHLDPNLGENILHPTDPAIYNSNDNFKNFFKGVYIKPNSPTNSNILRFRSKHANTKLTLYYTDTSGTDTPKKFDFLTDEDAESFINYNHNYTNKPAVDTSLQDTVVYLQGMDGVGFKIDLTDVVSNQLGNIIVNKAELEIYAIDGNFDAHPVTRQLVATELQSDGTYDYIDDVLTSFTQRGDYLLFGGVVNKSNPAKLVYKMNISQYLQRVADGETYEKSLYIQAASVIDASRVRIGTQNSYLPAKLSLTYTVLD